jgi:hypothetical protein
MQRELWDASSTLLDGQYGIYGVHLTNLSDAEGAPIDILATTVNGQLLLRRFDGSAQLAAPYPNTQYIAPALGAFNSIVTYDDPAAFGGHGGTRAILSSASGLHGVLIPRLP